MSYLKLVSEPKFLKRIFIACATAMLLVMLSVSGDYGITWDEKIQKDYGENILKFYSSGGKDTSYIDRTKFIHLYGGFVETISAVATKFSGGDVYNTRHLIVAIFGFITMLFTGLLAKKLAGWPAGIIALLFIFFTPVFFGHSMYNSKDIPFAASYILSIYFLICFLKQFPKPTLSVCIFLALSIAMAINIRIGGLLLIAYLLLFWVLKIISILVKEKDIKAENVKQIRKSFFYVLGISVLSYFMGMLFWPYGLTNPLSHPFEALTLMANYEAFDSYNLFDGKWIHRWEVPWYYIPKWIWITTPLFISLSVLFVPLVFIKSKNIFSSISKNYFVVIVFAFLFPILYIIIKSSNVYDGWRHALFVYPPVVAICAVMWTGFLKIISKNIYKLLSFIVLSFSIFQPAFWMYNNHPFESFYFSPLIGGINGAFKKYEIDYYGTSIREAVEWIAENSDKTKSNRVRCWYGETESCEHFVKKYKNLKYVFANEESLDWDYSIVLPAQAKFDSLLLKNWPPQGTVFEAYADTVPIIAVVKNFRTPELISENQANAVYTSTDINFLINSSIQFYNSGNYLMCIAACERVLVLDASNKFAYNNICSSFNQLKMYNEAMAAGQVALQIDSVFISAKANYSEAVSNLKKQVSADTLSINYTNLSVIYSKLEQYQRSIAFCQFAIKNKSDNAFAYNNICSAYNALGKFSEAVPYGEKAVQLDPSSELFKNNLQVAKSKLAGK